MNVYFGIANAFLEDTCVIIVLAYLLARGRMLSVLFDTARTMRRTVFLGSVFGLIGLTEVIFPGARYPYVTNTLIITFAAFMVGLQPALVASALLSACSLLLQRPVTVVQSLGTDCVTALVGAAFARLFRERDARSALICGICAQTGAVLLLSLDAKLTDTHYSFAHSLISIPANGLGMLLLLLVLRDARLREESQQHKTEAERSIALIAEARICAIRARIHPHFLFNTLNSIAALCGIAPSRAEAAVIQLSRLMRRSLDLGLTEPLSLSSELEYVDAYLAIEQLRFEDRLMVRRSVDPACGQARVPGFAVQTLVENAIEHGVSSCIGPAELCITVCRAGAYVRIAVLDNGPGIADAARRAAEGEGNREHGLQILNAQMRLLYGTRSRVRLLRRPQGGTLAAIYVPAAGR